MRPPSPTPAAVSTPGPGAAIGVTPGSVVSVAAETPSATDSLGSPELDSLGRVIAQETGRAAQQAADWISDFYKDLRTTLRRLSGLDNIDLGVVWAAAQEIAIIFVVTIGTLILLYLATLPIRRALGRIGKDAGFVRTGMIIAASLVLNVAMLLLAWACGYAVSLLLISPDELPPGAEIQIHQALYLNAFLFVGLVKAVIRTILAPEIPELRLLPMSDKSAAHWMLWLTTLIGILGYGQFLIIPLVNEAANKFVGNAVTVLINLIVLITALVLIIANRHKPRDYYAARSAAAPGDVTLLTLALIFRFWHLAAIAYFTLLFVLAVTDTGQVLPVLLTTGRVAAVIAVGVFIAEALRRASVQGVSLPAHITERLPLLETRINTFVPRFLQVARLVILLMVVIFTLDVVGIADVGRWLEGSLGVDLASTTITISLILLGAFVIWLILTSWVDYRLTPRRGKIVTSREQTLLTLLRNAASIAIVIITLMFSLSEMGLDIAPLLASAGVLGLAIGFGAQKLVQDIITGIFIQFENAINVGDYVSAGGIGGTVEKLTIRSVSLRDLEGVFHIVPFSSVDSVSNYNKGFGYHVADVGIAYREDIDQAKAVMIAAFDELVDENDQGRHVMGDFEWFGVNSLGDSAVVLRGRIKARPGWQWAVGRAYNEIVKKRLDDAGIEIPFPQTTIWFGENKDYTAPPAHIRMSPETKPRAVESPTTESRDVASPTQDEPDGD